MLLYNVLVFKYLEIMIGGPQPSGGMEGLKSQLKSGSGEGGAEGANGVTEGGEATDGGDDQKGTQIYSRSLTKTETIDLPFQLYIEDLIFSLSFRTSSQTRR